MSTAAGWTGWKNTWHSDLRRHHRIRRQSPSRINVGAESRLNLLAREMLSCGADPQIRGRRPRRSGGTGSHPRKRTWAWICPTRQSLQEAIRLRAKDFDLEVPVGRITDAELRHTGAYRSISSRGTSRPALGLRKAAATASLWAPQCPPGRRIAAVRISLEPAVPAALLLVAGICIRPHKKFARCSRFSTYFLRNRYPPNANATRPATTARRVDGSGVGIACGIDPALKRSDRSVA